MEHSTAANPPPKAHTRKPNGGGYAAVQTFHAIKKKPRSLIKRKEVIEVRGHQGKLFSQIKKTKKIENTIMVL
jgi:hypothetical protein